MCASDGQKSCQGASEGEIAKHMLTTEWIDGIKLTYEIGLKKACLNTKELIDQVFDINHFTFCDVRFYLFLFGTQVIMLQQ